METNITYTISENNDTIREENENWKQLEMNNTESLMENETFAVELDYKLNYPIKYLQAILEYYGLKKSKLNKDLMARLIAEFESNLKNEKLVNKRKRLFENIEELKNDEYFRKYIIWNI